MAFPRCGALRGWGPALCWGLALCCLCGAGPLWSDNHEWKKLILTQHWPPTVCKEVNRCQDSLDYWTIHGLWPDKGEECNRSWHFNLDEIKDLLRDMKIYWPDVIHPSSNRSQFWKHEWDKHGTCAAEVNALNSEKKYFGKSLDLYKQVDLNSVLLKFGMKPSINYYNISDFKDALTRFYGVVPKIQCLLPEKGEQVQTIGQIELCFTKEDLYLRNCTEPGEQLSPKPGPKKATGCQQDATLCVSEAGSWRGSLSVPSIYHAESRGKGKFVFKMPIAQLLELWKKIEVEPMEIETGDEDPGLDAEPAAEDAAEEGKEDQTSVETQPAESSESSSSPVMSPSGASPALEQTLHRTSQGGQQVQHPVPQQKKTLHPRGALNPGQHSLDGSGTAVRTVLTQRSYLNGLDAKARV